MQPTLKGSNINNPGLGGTTKPRARNTIIKKAHLQRPKKTLLPYAPQIDTSEKNHLMKILLFSALLFLLSTAFQPAQKETLVQKAARIHNAVFTIDTHCDTPMNLYGSEFNVAERHDAKTTDTKVDLPRMKEGGLDAQFWAVFLSQGIRTDEGHACLLYTSPSPRD